VLFVCRACCAVLRVFVVVVRLLWQRSTKQKWDKVIASARYLQLNIMNPEPQPNPIHDSYEKDPLPPYEKPKTAAEGGDGGGGSCS